MEATTIALCALLVSGTNLLLNYVIYRNNKGKADNERINTLESGLSKKITDLGEQVDEDVSQLRVRIESNDTDIAHLKEGAEHAPTHNDLGKLHEKINGVRSDVSGLGGKLDGMNRLLGTIHEHLLRDPR
ncbi:MAG: hypothetical protein PHQ05_10165 [Sterolibacterium sp.]|nr:hypothetical protein [Sterolibacterium sp.]